MNTIIFYMYFMHVVSLTISVTQWVQTDDFIDEETELKESNITQLDNGRVRLWT